MFAIGVAADHLPQIVRNRVEQLPLASRKILQRAIMDKNPAAMNEWVSVHESRATHTSLPYMGHERRCGDRLGQLIKPEVTECRLHRFRDARLAVVVKRSQSPTIDMRLAARVTAGFEPPTNCLSRVKKPTRTSAKSIEKQTGDTSVQ